MDQNAKNNCLQSPLWWIEHVISPPHRTQGSSQKRKKKDSKRQRSWRTRAKQWPPDMTEPVHSWAHSCCSCLHLTCRRYMWAQKGPLLMSLQSVSEHRRQRSSWACNLHMSIEESSVNEPAIFTWTKKGEELMSLPSRHEHRRQMTTLVDGPTSRSRQAAQVLYEMYNQQRSFPIFKVVSVIDICFPCCADTFQFRQSHWSVLGFISWQSFSESPYLWLCLTVFWFCSLRTY